MEFRFENSRNFVHFLISHFSVRHKKNKCAPVRGMASGEASETVPHQWKSNKIKIKY